MGQNGTFDPNSWAMPSARALLKKKKLVWFSKKNSIYQFAFKKKTCWFGKKGKGGTVHEIVLMDCLVDLPFCLSLGHRLKEEPCQPFSSI